MKKILVVLASLALVACQPAEEVDALAAVLEAQPDEMKARYQYRHPQATIEFVGIEPGMTVVEGLPGGGWYSKILLPYLGSEGHVIAVDYSLEMYPNFSFATEEFLANQANWTTDFPAGAVEWAGENGAGVSAFHFGSVPEELHGTADVVFFARVLHNLARFEADGGYLTTALADVHALLKPGGVFGIVQHHARDEMSDEFADGSHGYLNSRRSANPTA